MGPNSKFHSKNKLDKRFFSKNKNIKLYKEKQSKIDSFKREVECITQQYEQVDFNALEHFNEFPFTGFTHKGLREFNYTKPTDIQRETIGLALKGHDILGAAQTGSGKTLAFVIPILERLYCSGWSILDGLGALVITPTRELAYQIFEVLNKVGRYHKFSVALVIGGKDIANERKLLDKCNILICTPGRLLQHMDENPFFSAMNMKILVLDEADRLLDLGFQKSLNAIIENLPPERQTMLFSATQTKCVKDLARLSLKNPVYVSVHEFAKHATPKALTQSYMVCEAHDKMNMLWSFIKSHKKQKILIFMSSCKQVKYTCESFCRLRPGVSVMSLYGSMHQLRRMQIYDDFCRKNHVVLLATDIAARGLDFPNVNWVVQLDCPDDVNTYIHRAGRTARHEDKGESLLVLLPREKESMVEKLKSKKVPIEELQVNPSKLVSIQKKLETVVGRDFNLAESCQRAFKAYLKSIYLMKDKSVFDVTSIDFEKYAISLGLQFTPRVRFLEKHLKNSQPVSTKQPMMAKPKFDVESGSSDESDDELLNLDQNTLNKLDADSYQEDFDHEEPKISKKPLTKAALAKRMLKKNVRPNTITKFDDNFEAVREVCGQTVPVVAADLKQELLEEGYSIEKAKLIKEKEDEVDRLLYKKTIKDKRREEKLKKKEKLNEEELENEPAILNKENDSKDESGSEEDIDPNTMALSESESEKQEESSVDEKTSSDEDSQHHDTKSWKRKTSDPQLQSKKIRLSEKPSASSSRTMEDDEQLALHYLTNI